MIEQNKAEILSLYALLNMKEIVKVYGKCRVYMETLNEGKTNDVNSEVEPDNLANQNDSRELPKLR